jgi:hypothetical protein
LFVSVLSGGIFSFYGGENCGDVSFFHAFFFFCAAFLIFFLPCVPAVAPPAAAVQQPVSAKPISTRQRVWVHR